MRRKVKREGKRLRTKRYKMKISKKSEAHGYDNNKTEMKLLSWWAGTADFVLAFRPHSDLLARMSTVSAGRNSRFCSIISASFPFTRQNVYCNRPGRFARRPVCVAT